MKKYLKLLLIIFGLHSVSVGAQDLHFSQFYENAILRNPALTGIFSGDYKVGVDYRTQWSSITPFNTALATAETRIMVDPIGDYLSFGVATTYDKAGSIDFTSMQVYPAINFNKSMEDKHNSYFSVGFTGGYIQRSVDMSKMTFSSQAIGGVYNSSNASGENLNFKQLQTYDLGAGFSVNSSAGNNNQVNYYIGAAAYHVLKPNQTFSGDEQLVRLSTKWTGNLGLRCNVTDQFSFSIHFNYTAQDPYKETIGGGLLGWRTHAAGSDNIITVNAGAFYRVNDAIIPTVKIDYTHYSITMSYDDNTSTLKTATQGQGGFEISLYIRGNYKREKSAADAVKCPRFEDINGTMQGQ